VDSSAAHTSKAPTSAFAVGLRPYQLEHASGDDRTKLPKGLTRPAHWPASANAQPEEPDNSR
jgi:hypothetical protein